MLQDWHPGDLDAHGGCVEVLKELLAAQHMCASGVMLKLQLQGPVARIWLDRTYLDV